MEMKIKHIVAWESLTHRAFTDFDLSSSEDVAHMIYILSGSHKTYAAYSRSQQAVKDVRTLRKALTEELAYFQQFVKTEETDPEDKKEENETKSKPLTLSSIIGKLAYRGCSLADLLDSDISLIPYISSIYTEGVQEEQEAKRFWARVMLSPYIKPNTANSLQEFLPFPWERPEDKISDEDVAVAKYLFKKKKL